MKLKLAILCVVLSSCSVPFNYFHAGTGSKVLTCRHDIPRLEEDEVPYYHNSAKLKDYSGEGSGCAIYSDGFVYDSKGWHK